MALLLMLISALAFASGIEAQPLQSPDKPKWSQPELVGMIGDVIDLIVENYVNPVDEATLVHACLRSLPGVPASSAKRSDAASVLAKLEESQLDRCFKAMVGSLDANSRYMAEYDFAPQRGRFAGIGVHLHQKADEVVIIGTIDSGPAERAGLVRGDLLVSIDGQDTSRRPVAEIADLLRGTVGSTVVVGIKRSTGLQEITLKRAVVRADRVSGRAVAPGIGYVNVMAFNEDTISQLRAALQTTRDDALGPLKGLILDLRWSPGGLLSTAVMLSAAFLRDDLAVVELRGRAPASSRQYRVRRADYGRYAEDLLKLSNAIPELASIPIVVLVSSETTSGAEVVAAALQDNGRAIVVGEQTAGRGDLATIFPLGRMRGVRLTTGLMYRPSGESIDAKGVQPTILVRPAVERPSDGLPLVPPRAAFRGVPEDPVVAKAIQILRQRLTKPEYWPPGGPGLAQVNFRELW
jgi:carboxyl-terminal processing protease